MANLNGNGGAISVSKLSVFAVLFGLAFTIAGSVMYVTHEHDQANREMESRLIQSIQGVEGRLADKISINSNRLATDEAIIAEQRRELERLAAEQRDDKIELHHIIDSLTNKIETNSDVARKLAAVVEILNKEWDSEKNHK
jgi:hypothetical protein